MHLTRSLNFKKNKNYKLNVFIFYLHSEYEGWIDPYKKLLINFYAVINKQKWKQLLYIKITFQILLL